MSWTDWKFSIWLYSKRHFKSLILTVYSDKVMSGACKSCANCCRDVWLRGPPPSRRSSTTGLIKPCLHEASRQRQAMCCSAKTEWPSQPAPLSKMEISSLQTDNASLRQPGRPHLDWSLAVSGLPVLIKQYHADLRHFCSFNLGLQSNRQHWRWNGSVMPSGSELVISIEPLWGAATGQWDQ